MKKICIRTNNKNNIITQFDGLVSIITFFFVNPYIFLKNYSINSTSNLQTNYIQSINNWFNYNRIQNFKSHVAQGFKMILRFLYFYRNQHWPCLSLFLLFVVLIIDFRFLHFV